MERMKGGELKSLVKALGEAGFPVVAYEPLGAYDGEYRHCLGIESCTQGKTEALIDTLEGRGWALHSLAYEPCARSPLGPWLGSAIIAPAGEGVGDDV